MPLYMDVHIVPGVDARAVAEAHRNDLLIQDEHHCQCMTYWIDQERESVFCLVEAPNKEAVIELHSEAHGLIPNKIIEVSHGLVSSFLGRLYDPVDAEISSDGLKLFADPSFRILLVTTVADPFLLEHDMGQDKAKAVLSQQDEIVRRNVLKYDGSEVEHDGNIFIGSFSSATKALACASSIRAEIAATASSLPGLKMSINAGVPVAKANKLFGDTVQFAEYLCYISKDMQISVASSVKELLPREAIHQLAEDVCSLWPQDEKLLESLFNTLEDHYRDPDFDIPNYCNVMAMSKSQLYRKTTALTGLSPNHLLKEFRLDKALQLMKKKPENVSDIAFDTGFTSPSYFTKCFKSKYGILPITYLDLIQ